MADPKQQCGDNHFPCGLQPLSLVQKQALAFPPWGPCLFARQRCYKTNRHRPIRERNNVYGKNRKPAAPAEPSVRLVDPSHAADDKLEHLYSLCWQKFSSLHPQISHNVLPVSLDSVSYTHLRAHETVLDLVCRILLDT